MFPSSFPMLPARRRILAGAGAAALLAALGRPAAAQDAYPSRALTVIVPYAPGGQGDVFARLLGERLGAAFKQTVVVENRPGASGTVGTRQVARAEADGYHLLLGQTGEMAVNPFVMRDLGYDPQHDFTAVALVGDSPLVLVVPAASPHADLVALVEAARAKPDSITYASSGTATPGHLAAAALALATQARMVHVPYKGAGQAMTDLLGGHVDFFFSSASAAMPHVSAGKLKALAVSTPQRVAALPKVPAVAEQVAPGFQFSLWGGYFVPAGTPAAIVQRLNQEINAVLADPGIRARFEADGTVVRQNTPDEFAAFVRSEADKYRRLVQATGVRAEG
ncbi:tripartite tricarboxylate transporter substrate binding protein [Bordetella sp. BOR01]|uniref:Bug family tripartite tricarboxylate transporter substrate binding protein n=1 Tax=Bordetella sp. BOR01 TaxID=2854779 RepID=UPI001C46BBFE|nr:tripartite tricarboxylate transporter substrate binding protein [Bordetella sp. BOR01]MBV7482062.1 tripartite tricarboxylate transporter substrate binding protein [Bordetella sp. BOR01]